MRLQQRYNGVKAVWLTDHGQAWQGGVKFRLQARCHWRPTAAASTLILCAEHEQALHGATTPARGS
jgi:hypothetical protein